MAKSGKEAAREFRRLYTAKNWDDWMSVSGHSEDEFDDNMLAAYAHFRELAVLREAAKRQCSICAIGGTHGEMVYPEFVRPYESGMCFAAAIHQMIADLEREEQE